MADRLRVCALYPDLMNIYADRGNLSLLRKRCEWRGIGFELTGIGLERAARPRRGGPLLHRRRPGPRPGAVRRGHGDAQARRAARGGGARRRDLRRLRRLPAARPLLRAGRREAPGRRPRRPPHRPRGRPAADRQRRDRDRRRQSSPASRTTAAGRYLGAGEQPLGRVLRGHGNDGRSGFEGVRKDNVIGTYLHGPLLPKNAWFADFLTATALDRDPSELPPLDDTLEDAAHAAARRAAGLAERVG